MSLFFFLVDDIREIESCLKLGYEEIKGIFSFFFFIFICNFFGGTEI
jgi:hypothetical protein